VKVSNRARRIQRHYKRMHKAGGLNLVSLMDIFTILVFFLMVNSSDVQVLQQGIAVKLPESVAEQDPRETLVITVTENDVMVAGRAIAKVSDLRAEGETLAGLKTELDYQASRALKPVAEDQPGRPITILADRELPYQMLKKIMATCVAAGYSNISLAVSRKAESGV
jgi:biopolymer transport protein TolR